MAASEPILTETLLIRRLGVVTDAVVTVRPDDDLRELGWQRKTTTTAITLPAHFFLGDGWQLTHQCPTTGQEVKDNCLVELFHDTRYLNRLRLSSYYLRNRNLLDAIASVFDRLRVVEADTGGWYKYMVDPAGAPTPVQMGGEPALLYYKPIEGGSEQFLMLYNQGYAWNERGVVDASRAEAYEIVQVELDEAVFLRLLREALEAAERARLK